MYRRFVQGFSKVAEPLTDMTRKNTDVDWDSPTDSRVKVFEELRKRMVWPPLLALPQVRKPYVIDTDASAYQLFCRHLQQQDDPGSWHPIGYWSYALNERERNYSSTERECYAVVWEITSLRTYIEGAHFTVRTDHDPLRSLMRLKESSCRLTRWRLRLSEFDFTIEYRPGRVHRVLDALSRLVAPNTGNHSEIDDEVPTFEGDLSLFDGSSRCLE